MSGRKRRGITGENVGFDGKNKEKKDDTLEKAEEKVTEEVEEEKMQKQKKISCKR